MKGGKTFALCAGAALFAAVAFGAERYSPVRTFKVDGKDVALAPGEKVLDLGRIYGSELRRGEVGTRWTTVEMSVESEAEKTVPFYYRNDWFGELQVNGVTVAKDLQGPYDDFAKRDVRLKRGTNVIVFRTRAGSAGEWLCQFAFEGVKRPGEADAAVDFTKTAGKVRPRLHASGFGPKICSFADETKALIKSMNLTAARTHDWALINANERVCDYFHVFPLMNLDATKPEHYHFAPTDYLLKRTREELGLDVFYRLGTSIEHSGKKVHFNSLIPEDFDKVAEIFAGTVRHYNRSWADGFDWGIKYWEIWNEPDGTDNMWCLPDGDSDPDPKVAREKANVRRDRFVKFFVTCLKRLKSEFPEIKVGGPAMCSMRTDYFTALLDACRAAGVAPDFISWHYYGSSVEGILGTVAKARKLCDEKGFGTCELVLDEWHYMGCDWGELRSSDPAVRERVWQGPASHNGTDSAAFTLSVLSRFQASRLDQSYFYGCSHTGAWGFMDEFRRLYKVYYSLKLFGEIVRDYPVLGEVQTVGTVTTLVAKSADGARTALLVSDYRGLPGDIVLETKGLPAGRPTARILDHTRNLEPVDARVESGRLVLPKSGDASSSYLVVW